MEEEYDLGELRPAKKIAIDLAGMKRRDIRRAARELVNSENGSDYVDPDNVLDISGDSKSSERVFRRAANKQYNKNVDYTNRQNLKQEAVEAAKRGDSEAFATALSKQQSQAGSDIFNKVKTVAEFVPGAVGTTMWLANAGADALNGDYKNSLISLGLGLGMGALGKGIAKGAGNVASRQAARNLKRVARKAAKNGQVVNNIEYVGRGIPGTTENVTALENLTSEIKKYLTDKNGVEPTNITRADIEDWMTNAAKDPKSSIDYLTLNKNWNAYINDLTTPESYNGYKPASDSDLLAEAAIMGRKEIPVMDMDTYNSKMKDLTENLRINTEAYNSTGDDYYKMVMDNVQKQIDNLSESHPINISNIKAYYKEDVLPRLLENLKKNGIKLEQQDIDYITNLYSDPLKGVDIAYGYTKIGSGGYSQGPNYIRYPIKYGIDDVAENTMEHELHHSLRNRLGQYLAGRGLNKEAFGEWNPNTKEWEAKYEKLLSGEDARNRTEYMTPEYMPSEYKAMEDLAMNKQYSADKTPADEIAASLSEIRFNRWNKFIRENHRNPTVEELNELIKNADPVKLSEWMDRGHLSYDGQIGSQALDDWKEISKNSLKRLTNAKNNLPFFKRLFLRTRDAIAGSPAHSTEALKEYHRRLGNRYKRVMLEVPSVAGAVVGANTMANNNEEQTNEYKQGGILKRIR